tara:strand:+ start:423 stop:584 length:162 start_codon:yes stop_codon:yes gene_type:complete
MREYIKKHKDEIDRYIRNVLDMPDFKINNEEREIWVRNDLALYEDAKTEGVKV